MILKSNLNIGFYFIRNGSLTSMKNVFVHLKLNLKLSLFQNLDLEYSISPVVVPRSELSINLFCKIPKSKILTKKKLWSRSGEIGGNVRREATLLNVQCGRFEVLSNPKTLYGQWQLLGYCSDHLPQRREKEKSTDKFQIVPTHQESLAMRDFTFHQLVPSNPMGSSLHSQKCQGSILENCMMYALFLGVLGFGFWAKTKNWFTGWQTSKSCAPQSPLCCPSNNRQLNQTFSSNRNLKNGSSLIPVKNNDFSAY